MADLQGTEHFPIMYSNEKLKILLEESSLPIKEVFKKYIESINYERVPDFPQGMSWLNVKEPLSFKKHLKGKLVLLDFFTYCCINCMHILPDLKEIEQAFSVEDGLVVIGVHSAKFDNEKIADNVRNAVLRYNIEHPVLNDEGALMWQQCDVHCWPTLLLISPDGLPLVMLMGEGHKESLKLYIKHFLDHYKNEISHRSLPIEVKSNIQHSNALFFPGKIRAYKDLLCISDSGNNRILVIRNCSDMNKWDCTIIGSPYGKAGFVDGNLNDALFNQPQGVVFYGEDLIFVADTENHAIRRIDLRNGLVSTIAGNGSQSSDRSGGRIGTQQGISSPWDVDFYLTDDKKPMLLIAMAGTHQIWAIFFEDTKWWKGKEYSRGAVASIAGSGREENRNNNYPNNASFAQPSGLALHRESHSLFIADSESSSIRKLSLLDGKVSAVVGGDKNPNNLFAFGDEDGAAFNAKLQHCIGLATYTTPQQQCRILIADTYNHKIKSIDINANSVTTVKTSVQFNEPCGLCQSSDGRLFVADTNNHEIKVCSLRFDNDATAPELMLFDVLKLDHLRVEVQPDAVDKIRGEEMHISREITMSNNGTISFTLRLLDNLHWTDGAPQKWKVTSSNISRMTPSEGSTLDNIAIKLNTSDNQSTSGEIMANFILFTCLKDLCFNRKFSVKVPLRFITTAPADNVVDVSIGQDRILLS